MQRVSLLRAGTVACCLAVIVSPALAADPPPAVAAAQPAQTCLSDVHALSARMNRDGYWMGGSDYGYGMPMGGYGDMSGPADYYSTRPGYEIKTLVSAANILAHRGEQQACAAVLAVAGTMYAAMAAGLHGPAVAGGAGLDWQRRQIAGATPVTNQIAALRMSSLVDTSLLNPQAQTLGSVHDVVLSPKTGRIAYLIIGRGGIFGFDQTYTPVPWQDFKATQNVNVLVLDATETGMANAPVISDAQFTARGQFAAESGRVDAYWQALLPAKTAE
jgi:sporulation protein YlmC with PRC-barrel domain